MQGLNIKDRKTQKVDILYYRNRTMQQAQEVFNNLKQVAEYVMCFIKSNKQPRNLI